MLCSANHGAKRSDDIKKFHEIRENSRTSDHCKASQVTILECWRVYAPHIHGGFRLNLSANVSSYPYTVLTAIQLLHRMDNARGILHDLTWNETAEFERTSCRKKECSLRSSSPTHRRLPRENDENTSLSTPSPRGARNIRNVSHLDDISSYYNLLTYILLACICSR